MERLLGGRGMTRAAAARGSIVASRHDTLRLFGARG
jgi:hypothetical protein